jgi:hypothetical protein
MLPGVSFSPGKPEGTPSQQQPASPLQDAIKILSFRMPTTVGAGGVSPLANDPLGGGHVQDWLLKLFQGFTPAQPQMAGPSPSPMGPMVPPQGVPSFGGNVAPPTSAPSAPSPNVVLTPPGLPKMQLPEMPGATPFR